jgi:hypothetical protein
VKSIFRFVFSALLVILCGAARCESEDDTAPNMSSLAGKKYVLEVNRSAKQPDIRNPGGELSEDDYEKTEKGARYRVSFSDDLKTVEIKDSETVSGNL